MSYELGIIATREFSYSEQSGCFQCKIRVCLPAGAEGLLLRELRGNVHYIGELLKDDWGYVAKGSFTGFRFRETTIGAASSEEIRRAAAEKVSELRDQIEEVYKLNYLASKAVPKYREAGFVICALPDYEDDDYVGADEYEG